MTSPGISLSTFGLDDQAQAIALLGEGFPHVRLDVWRAGFQRLRETPPPGSSDAIGCFLNQAGSVKGLSLAISRSPASERETASTTNLSSWYIAPPMRHRALWMFQNMTTDPGRIYTDLSPTTTVARLIQLVGFRLISSQTLLIPTPALASLRSPLPSVVPTSQTLDATDDGSLRSTLQDHLDLGCKVIGLEDGSRVQPLVFAIKRRAKLIRTVQLIYTGSVPALLKNMCAISNYFLRRGVMLIEAQVPDDAVFDFGCVPYFKRRYAKGSYPKGVVDQLYSEAVYFRFD